MNFLVTQEQKLGAMAHWDLLEHSPVCIFKPNFCNKRKEGVYQDKVNLCLTSTQRLGY